LATVTSAMREHRRQFDTSVGVSGPRDLAVRIDAVRRRENKPRCNIDTPTASRLNVRDDREAPLLSRRDDIKRHQFLKKRKRNIFRKWTGRGDPFDAARKMSFLAQAVLAAIAHGLAGTGRPIAHLRRLLRR
jgi:hypothetical protein